MPFTLSTIDSQLITTGTKAYAAAQPLSSQRMLLYGIEVYVKNGYSADPEADIYVFSNPRAAEVFLKTLDADFTLESYGMKGDSSLACDLTHPEKYIVTAQRADFPTSATTLTPASIPGCSYSDTPKPYTTLTENYPFPKMNSSYLTVVAVLNAPSSTSETTVSIKTILDCA